MGRFLRVCSFSFFIFLPLAVLSPAAHAGLTANPTSINFGNQVAGSGGITVPVTLANTDASRTFTIVSITASGNAFSVTGASLPASLPPGQSLTVSVVFTPTAAQTYSGTVGFTTYYGWTVNVPLSGVGIQNQPDNQLSITPTSLNFGSVSTGSSATQTIQLFNSTGSAIAVNNVQTSGNDISVQGFSPGAVVEPGQTLILSVNFSPSAVENATGQILFSEGAATSPIAVAWSGESAAPNPGSITQGPVTVSPSSLNFSNVNLGAGNTQLLTITNDGSTPVTLITMYMMGPDISVTGWTAGTVIPPNESLAVIATFAPQSVENVSGSIGIFTDAVSAAFEVPWTGNSGQPQTPLTTAVQAQTSSSASAQPQTSSTTAQQQVSSSSTVAQTQTTSTATAVVNDSVSLLWNPSESSGVIGYNVYRGTVSGGPYSLITPVMVAATAYFDSAVSSGQTYYYVVTSLDPGAVESAYSPEAVAAVP
jgi:hypothetical protein